MPDTALENRIVDHSKLSPADVALILKLADDGKTQTFIAQQIGCSQSAVSRCLSEFIDTRAAAKRLAHNAAERLTKRVIKDADVEQSLEVLDRIGVLEKRQYEKTAGVQVIVGLQVGQTVNA